MAWYNTLLDRESSRMLLRHLLLIVHNSYLHT